MAQGLLGKKLGMSQVFDQFGNLLPVTVLQVGPNKVIQVKRHDGKDGYSAIKVGFGDKKVSRINRPELGVFKHAGVDPVGTIREFRIDDSEIDSFEVGQTLSLEMFEPGSKVDVTGTTKGHGFQGVVKRHGFKGAKESTHGTQKYRRHAGSIGMSAYPARVIKGKKMAGQMGNDQFTCRALTVVAVYPDENIMMVKGAVPGAKQGFVQVAVSSKQPAFI
jgi:large subunit ribosomal protein L3